MRAAQSDAIYHSRNGGGESTIYIVYRCLGTTIQDLMADREALNVFRRRRREPLPVIFYPGELGEVNCCCRRWARADETCVP
jgi:hypothetical protein